MFVVGACRGAVQQRHQLRSHLLPVCGNNRNRNRGGGEMSLFLFGNDGGSVLTTKKNE